MLSVEQPKLCPVFSTGYRCYRIESVSAIQSLQFHHLLSSWNLGNKHVKHIRLHEPPDGADSAPPGCWFATAHFDVLVILLRELLSPNFRPQANFLVQDLGSRVNHATGLGRLPSWWDDWDRTSARQTSAGLLRLEWPASSLLREIRRILLEHDGRGRFSETRRIV